MTQRERFENICGSFPFCMPMHTYVNGDYRDTDTKRAWAIWQAACPEGWQAIPVDPTAGMLTALWKKDPFERYPVMLDAAPKPEDVWQSSKQ